jgi:hypothetical protein
VTKLIHRFPKPLVPLIVEALDIERARRQTILNNTISRETGDPLFHAFTMSYLSNFQDRSRRNPPLLLKRSAYC